MSMFDLKEALEMALGKFLNKLSQDVAKQAYETGETARAVGIASQQLRRIADVLDAGRRGGPARFARVLDRSTRTILVDVDLSGLRQGELVRILSPSLEPRHAEDFLEVHRCDGDRREIYVTVPVATCAGDWLEWHPLRLPR